MKAIFCFKQHLIGLRINHLPNFRLTSALFPVKFAACLMQSPRIEIIAFNLRIGHNHVTREIVEL